MIANNKEYILKFYSQAGTFVKSVSAFRWNSIRNQINAGLGSFSFTLLNKFDDFQEGYTVKLNNRVELTVVDNDTGPDGLVVYSGYITSYQPQVKGTKEQVSVTAFGYLSKLATSLAHIGSQVSSLVTDGTGISALPSGTIPVSTSTENVLKAAIDSYRASSINPVVNYATGSIGSTGTTMQYTFNEAYYQEMLDTCLKAAPARWFYYAGADNIVYFGPAPSAPTHTFTFQKDFENISILINGDTIVNNVLFESSNDYVKILRRVEDSTSESLMDDRWTIIKDNSVASTGTADNIANSYLNNNKDPKRKIVVDIIDNNLQDLSRTFPSQTGYDIERIKPGDTCQFANFSDITSLSFGSNNLLIVEMVYTPGMATLTLEEISENTARDAVEAARLAQQAQGYSGLTTFGSSSASIKGYWETGDLKPTLQSVANPGWLFADGSVVLRSDYPDLFTAIGTSCNTGGESGVQFRLPDYRDRVPVGVSGSRAKGSTGGEANHTLSTGEIPSHGHGVNDGGHGHGLSRNKYERANIAVTAGGFNGTTEDPNGSAMTVSSSTTGISIQSTGGGGSHNNMQPYQACNWLVKT